MRKYLAIVLGAILMLSFAATASAMDADVTLGGNILVRGWYVNNLTTGNALLGDPLGALGRTFDLPANSDSQTGYTTDASITMDIKVQENVKGFMELETTMGGDPYTGEYMWGSNPTGYDVKPDANLHFRQLWIQYTGSGLLGVPAGIKIGHMPIALGEKQFVNNERFGDDAILMWVDPTKELHLAGVIAKLNEGAFNNHGDDIDAYVVLGTYQVDKDNLIGLNVTYIRTDDQCPSVGKVDEVNVFNVGAHGNGNISGFDWAIEGDVQFGQAEDVAVLGAADRVLYGWAILAKLGYMVDPVNFRAKFAYGSGDDDFTDEDCEEFQTLQGPDDIGALTRYIHHTQIYERWVSTAAVESLLTTRQGGNTRNTGIANTTLYNLGLDVNATPNIGLSIDGFYLQASETGAWEDIVGTNVDEELGWELDFRGTYKIAKNLSYFVEAAGFWPGDFYEDVHGVDETVTQVVHGLLLTF